MEMKSQYEKESEWNRLQFSINLEDMLAQKNAAIKQMYVPAPKPEYQLSTARVPIMYIKPKILDEQKKPEQTYSLGEIDLSNYSIPTTTGALPMQYVSVSDPSKIYDSAKGQKTYETVH